jgi:hypothetical protein
MAENETINNHINNGFAGRGVRFFGDLSSGPIELERTKVVDAPGVTHLIYRVLK